ncbi:MAG: tetratricopeptide repeat protein [Chloroflexi bacterium]|nr:tetratricopeptide repeat protein [Chloroflexota bacterium]
MFEKLSVILKRGSAEKTAREAKDHCERALASKDDQDYAIVELQTAIRIRPDFREPYFALGQVFYDRGDYDRAISNLARAIELKPDESDAYVGRGMAFDAKGDPAQAIADYDRAIELSPNEASTYLLRGTAHDKRGETEKAVADYRRVTELTADSDLHHRVGDRLRALGSKPVERPAEPSSPAPHAAPKEPSSAYRESRKAILSTNPILTRIAPSKEAPNVWGVVIDLSLPEDAVTLAVLANGTTNLYFGRGGGILDAGKNGAVAGASKDLIVEAERWFKGMAPSSSSSFPLPSANRVGFHIMTFSGTFTADAGDSELLHGEHKLSPLFRTAQEVLTQVRRSKQQK